MKVDMKQIGHKETRLLVSLLQSRKKKDPFIKKENVPKVQPQIKTSGVSSGVFIITEWVFTSRVSGFLLKRVFIASRYMTGPRQNESKTMVV